MSCNSAEDLQQDYAVRFRAYMWHIIIKDSLNFIIIFLNNNVLFTHSLELLQNILCAAKDFEFYI